MGLFTKETPVGLDSLIDKAQKKLYSKLSAKWGVDLDAYPRCYVIENNDQVTVQHYIGNEEYSGTLLYNEVNKFFFTAEENQERVNNEQFTTNVSLYFIVDIFQIYPQSKDRSDGLILRDVADVLDKVPGFQSVYTIVTDYKTVFQDFDYELKNLQPYYYFRIDLKTMPYTIGQNC